MIEIYGKPNCAYCEQAKQLLESRGIPYQYIEVVATAATTGDQISREDFVEKFPSAKMVPQIVVQGQHLGGFAELKQYLGSPE
jgi:glutaredoxin